MLTRDRIEGSVKIKRSEGVKIKRPKQNREEGKMRLKEK